MTQKTLSIPEDLYFKLKAKKRNNETFPDLLDRLLQEDSVLEKKRNIMELAGAFGDQSDEWEKIEEKLYKDRLHPSSRKPLRLDD